MLYCTCFTGICKSASAWLVWSCHLGWPCPSGHHWRHCLFLFSNLASTSCDGTCVVGSYGWKDGELLLYFVLLCGLCSQEVFHCTLIHWNSPPWPGNVDPPIPSWQDFHIWTIFLPTSRKNFALLSDILDILPGWGPFCSDCSSFCPLSSSGQENRCFGRGKRCFVYVHIPERGVMVE